MNKPAPTEEQVKAANEAEQAKWQGDFKEDDLTIPYKREEAEEEQPKPPVKDNTQDDDEEEVAYADPTPVVTVEDPGDFTPEDYSFEVTLKDGKTVKVATPEEAEKLADDPDNFETPKQLMDFINKQNKMNRNLDRDRERWETQKKTYEEQTQTEQQRLETVNNMASEMDYLVSKNLMPAIEKKYLDADWSDPEIAKQPGVKEQIELLKYMVKENELRLKSKVKPLTSMVDAYNAWKLDTNSKKAEEEHRAAGEARKVAGARVAGVSPAQQGTYVPKGIAVGNPNVLKRGAAVWDD